MQTIKKNKISAFTLLLLGWILVYIGHNYIVPNTKIPILIAITDPATHGLVSLLLISPFVFFKKIDYKLGIFVISLGVLIDIDHIIAAHSFDPAAMIALLERPISHSVLFCVFLSLFFSFILKFENKHLIFYLCSMSLLSHVFRDAIDSNNTPWFYPFYSCPIPQSLFMVVFGGVSVWHLWWCMSEE